MVADRCQEEKGGCLLLSPSFQEGKTKSFGKASGVRATVIEQSGHLADVTAGECGCWQALVLEPDIVLADVVKTGQDAEAGNVHCTEFIPSGQGGQPVAQNRDFQKALAYGRNVQAVMCQGMPPNNCAIRTRLEFSPESRGNAFHGCLAAGQPKPL